MSLPQGNPHHFFRFCLGVLLIAGQLGTTARTVTLLHDSLEQRLRGTITDSERVDLHCQLALIYIDQLDDDRSMSHLREGCDLAHHVDHAVGLAYVPLIRGTELLRARNYAGALAAYKECINRLDTLGVKQGLLSPLGLIRQIYNVAGMPDEKLVFYTTKLDQYHRSGPVENTGACYHGIGGYYYATGQADKAIENYLRARNVFSTFDPVGYANQSSPVSLMYLSWGNIQKAEEYGRLAVEENLPVGLLSNILNTTGSMFEIHLAAGDTAAAIKALNSGRPYWARCTPQLLAPRLLALVGVHLKRRDLDSAAHYLGMADSLNEVARLPMHSVKGWIELDYYRSLYQRASGNVMEADESLERALRTAQDEGVVRIVQKYHKELASRYRERGMTQAALDHLEAYSTVSDSLEREAGLRKIAAYEQELEQEVSALEIQRQQAQLKQQRLVVYVIAIASVLLASLAVLAYRSFRLKRRAHLLISREKQRSEKLLLNILPGEVAEELKATGAAQAKQFDAVTILFTDFKGFTAMSEQLGPKELVRDIHECFSAFDHIMEKHGIEKIKTIGDAYMAAGGLPTPNTTHATDMINAAFEIRDFIAEGKARKVAAGLPYFEIRIGIHTGPVVAGIVGVKKFQYDIWGDTVNTASRLESSGEVGQVNISEATYALVKEETGLSFIPRGKVQAKGKGEMEMYFVSKNN